MPVLNQSAARPLAPSALALPHDWRRRAATAVTAATVIHVLVTLALLILLCGVSEDWWFSAALSYLPRAPYLLLSCTAIPALVLRRWGQAAVNVLCGLLIAGPIMGLCVPMSEADGSPVPTESLLVVSCNIQNGDADLHRLLSEIDSLGPDIIALQEVRRGGEVLTDHFAGWHTLHTGEYWISSRYPIRLVADCAPEVSRRSTGMLCEIDAPSGRILLFDVHLNTARHGLTELRWHSVLTGAGVEELRWHQWERRLEAEETLKFADDHAGLPMVIVGDFNTPTSSSLFRDVWSGWHSAFDAAGWGYGYTSPCNTSRLWPGNTPWLRIDHVLCDSAWRIHTAGIGRTDGSDHRLVWSRLSLRSPGRDRVATDLHAARRD